jgi:hypothetical protein
MASLFEFPNPVNDKAARVVATGVVAMGITFVVTGWGWVLIPLTYGFYARVLTGPTLSPLGQLATRVVAPRLGAVVETPGPPKRFAQAIGVAFTTAASITYVAGAHGAARIVIAALVVAAGLEAFAGLCLGCKAFALLMRVGLIPESVCVECGDLSRRYPELAER